MVWLRSWISPSTLTADYSNLYIVQNLVIYVGPQLAVDYTDRLYTLISLMCNACFSTYLAALTKMNYSFT